MAEQTFDKNEPYCGKCGHCLTGCTDSSRCPECGRPLVEVLARGMQWGKRYRSTATLLGLPVVDIAFGPAPGEKMGHARGVIALGDRATGFVAFGGMARGVVAFGGMSMGLFAYGGMALGVIAGWGGVAVGLLASGGLAIGGLAQGGMSLGFVAHGGMAIGYYAMGGSPLAVHRLGPGSKSPEVLAVLDQFSWFFGPPGFSLLNAIQPMLVVVGLGIVVASVFLLLAIRAHHRQGGEDLENHG